MKTDLLFPSNELSGKIIFAVIVTFWLLIIAAPSFALSKDYRLTLQGLKETYVYASRCNDTGSTEDSMLKTRAELRLRQAGLKILTEDNWTMANGKPQLYIFVCKRIGMIEMALKQEVLLARQQKVKT